MQAVLKKLFFKGQAPALVLNAPPEAKALAAAFGPGALSRPKGKAAFALAYAVDKAAAAKLAKAAPKFLEEGALFWVAYPKGSSRKYKADINRDTLNTLMEGFGFDGVSLVALDEDWSAMRYKGGSWMSKRKS
ncbi:MAG TPA: hypothetical protein VK914_05640 [bacterium]|jgi:hypothetical protein|nr:hypothetical protein [bacterium]